MNDWRASWAKAQITGLLFSSLVWIVVWGLSLPVLVGMLLVCVAAVAARNTRPMLWWRYAARPANDFQCDAMLAAIVPIASLRGRHQPSVWIATRLGGGQVVMPAPAVLVVSPRTLRQVVGGRLTERQASAIVAQAVGHSQVHDSTLVHAVDAYCLPWRVAQVLIGVARQGAGRIPLIGLSWKIRWVVFGLAAFDAYRNARWAALAGVILIAILSWTTGHFERQWARRREDLGDQRAIAAGLGPDLADLLKRSDRSSLAASERPIDSVEERRTCRQMVAVLFPARFGPFRPQITSSAEAAWEGNR
ncbi:MAG TPA: hypothetical protein VGK53_09785 [Propionicimonas sp.]